LRHFKTRSSTPFLHTLQHSATLCNILHYSATLIIFCLLLRISRRAAAHQSCTNHFCTHCTTLHHSATSCNTLQQYATYNKDSVSFSFSFTNFQTHRSTSSSRPTRVSEHALQHTATRCNTLQYSATLTLGFPFECPDAQRHIIIAADAYKRALKMMSEKSFVEIDDKKRSAPPTPATASVLTS